MKWYCLFLVLLYNSTASITQHLQNLMNKFTGLSKYRVTPICPPKATRYTFDLFAVYVDDDVVVAVVVGSDCIDNMGAPVQ